MTSPPPSETGATAEEIARTIKELYRAIPAQVTDREYSFARTVTPILKCLVSAAKRSAHLEDARAGCYACRDTVNYRPASQEPDHDRWVHVIATREEWGCVTCERPEVRDALSRLPSP